VLSMSGPNGQATPVTSQEDTAESSDAPRPFPPQATRQTPQATRHLLVVLGAEESDVVCAAGGLIYDWSLGGWDVVVYLGVSRDDRPLRILGAKAAPLARLDSLRSDSSWPQAIIASSPLYHQDRAVREYFNEASLRNYAATAMLGDDWPSGLGQGIGRLKHRLSPAAHAFKLQAMLAAELMPAALEPIELFRGFAQRFTSNRFIGVAPT
jgi:hypothetical protein